MRGTPMIDRRSSPLQLRLAAAAIRDEAAWMRRVGFEESAVDVVELFAASHERRAWLLETSAA
ncbi:MAG: hypothetical protein PGN07_03400 [Aeromicrobium erythreum]